MMPCGLRRSPRPARRLHVNARVTRAERRAETRAGRKRARRVGRFASPLDTFDTPRFMRSTVDDLVIGLCYVGAVALLALLAFGFYYLRERAARTCCTDGAEAEAA